MSRLCIQPFITRTQWCTSTGRVSQCGGIPYNRTTKHRLRSRVWARAGSVKGSFGRSVGRSIQVYRPTILAGSTLSRSITCAVASCGSYLCARWADATRTQSLSMQHEEKGEGGGGEGRRWITSSAQERKNVYIRIHTKKNQQHSSRPRTTTTKNTTQ